MGTSSTGLFNGTSQFSADFNNVVSRAVAIASLPMSQMQNDLAVLEDQSEAMGGLDARFAALESALDGIAEAMGGASYLAEVSAPAVIAATVTDGAVEGVYSIEVKDAGAYSSAQTTAAWNSAGVHRYRVQVGEEIYDLSPQNGTAAGVAAAINAEAGGLVRAVAVNAGSPEEPEYRLSLQATHLGDVTLAVLDNGVAMALDAAAGWEASYEVNNSGKTVSSDSRVVTIATGLTVTLKSSAEGSPVNITVTRSTSALSDALDEFATAYNETVTAVAEHTGTGGGALSGQTLIRTLQQSLSSLATYASDNGGVSGLADLGFDLSKEGILTFSPLLLLAKDIGNSSGVSAFFGSAAGGGFLKHATGILDSVQDARKGSLKVAESEMQTEIAEMNSDIAVEEARVAELERSLIERMSAADAAIAVMEQQYTYLSGMFQAMRAAAEE